MLQDKVMTVPQERKMSSEPALSDGFSAPDGYLKLENPTMSFTSDGSQEEDTAEILNESAITNCTTPSTASETESKALSRESISSGEEKPIKDNSRVHNMQVLVPAKSSPRNKSDSMPSEVRAEDYINFDPKSHVLFVTANGARGLDGENGAHGANGASLGEEGEDGEDATVPTPGKGAMDVKVHLSTENVGGDCLASVTVTITHPMNGAVDSKKLTFMLEEFPTIEWSAVGGSGGNGGIGGDGGNGSNGLPGRDATEGVSATAGGTGGDGGDGGAGTRGANGGSGGRVKFQVSKADSYLLMAVQPCEPDAILLNVKGGEGGKAGRHGTPGQGGEGGMGGELLNPALESGKRRRKFGIRSSQKIKFTREACGTDGRAGSAVSTPLREGRKGIDGRFYIEVDGREFSSIFQLELETLKLDGALKLDNGAFEFGSTVHVRDIVVRNTGKMPLYADQIVKFDMSKFDSSCLHLFEGGPLALLATSNDIDIGDQGCSNGCLSFAYETPKLPAASDFDPVHRSTSFKLSATIMAPPISNGVDATLHPQFSYPFKHFHDGAAKDVSFKFPVENTKGIKGIQSLCPEEVARFGFAISNVGLDPLGESALKPRRLALRFYASDGEPDNVLERVHFFASLGDTGYEAQMCKGGLVGSGTLVEVPLLSPDESNEAFIALNFGADVPLYSRVSFQAEILLEELPRDSDAPVDESVTDSLFVVQRRQLTLVCEPSYSPQKEAHAVLVTSTGTSLKQYESWVQSLSALGLKYETFSLSRHASLDPSFHIDNGLTLGEAFAHKVIIVLNDVFKMKPDKDVPIHQPLHFLPYGCMEEVSGFDESTRWLIVGSGASQPEEMLGAHVLDNREKPIAMKSVGQFRQKKQKELKNEAASGQITQDTAQFCYKVPVRRGNTSRSVAEHLSEWLVKMDQLRQYTVYYDSPRATTGKLQIHCGCCRSRNSVLVIGGTDMTCPKTIRCPAMLLAAVEAMPAPVRVERYCAAIRNSSSNEESLTAFRFATVSELLHEARYIAEAKLIVSDEFEDCFPTLGTFTDNLDVLWLINEAKTDEVLYDRVCNEFSDLIGRFQAVAQSKDLRPRYDVKARASKRNTHDALVDSVARLRRQWRTVIDSGIVDSTYRHVKKEVREHLGKGSSSKFERKGSHWLQGLAFVHSTQNTKLFNESTSIKSNRLIDAGHREDSVFPISAFDEALAQCHDRHELSSMANQRAYSQRKEFVLTVKGAAVETSNAPEAGIPC